ncbi:MAG: carboxypeptidase regulatory-like domain-containing protein [Planctomycetota bacterium]|nr:MAG: carboxypeptidase regulatory-like domain-containing protein [Planctomycetota bacterium]
MRRWTLWIGVVIAVVAIAWFAVRARRVEPDAVPAPLAAATRDASAPATSEPLASTAAVEVDATRPAPAREVVAAPAPERTQTPFGAVERVRVRGRLVTPDGSPVRDGHITGVNGTLGEISADANGAFEFDAHVVANAPIAQTYFYFATAEACSSRNFNAKPRAGEPCELGDIVLEPGCSLRATAVDERGSPIAGASIRLLPGAGEPSPGARFSGPPGGGVRHARTTAADGVLRLDGLQPGVKRAFLTAPGREWAWSAPLEVAPGRTADAGRLVLAARAEQARLALRLVDEQRRPVRAAVTVERGFFETSSVSTDADGRISIDCAPGETLQILCDTSSCERGPLVVEGLVVDGREHELLVPANPRVPLEVVDPRGAPIDAFDAHMQFDIAEKYWNYSSTACQITREARELPLLPTAFRLTVRASGFRSAVREFVAGERPARVRIELQPDPGVAGTVVAAGRPVAGARVALHRASEPHDGDPAPGFTSLCQSYSEAEGTTDVEGRFRIALATGGTWYASVAHAEFARALAGPIDVDAPGAAADLRIELDTGGAIEGFARGDRQSLERMQIVASSGDGIPLGATLDERGYFRFERLRAGTWQLAWSRPGTSVWGSHPSRAAARIRECKVAVGATTRCDLDVTPAAVLRGRIRIGSRPTVELRATIGSESNWQEQSVPLGADGSFEFLELDAGAARLGIADMSSSFAWSDSIELRGGENRWEWTPECGSLRTRLPLELGAVVWTLELRPEIGGTLQVPLSGDVQGEVWLPWLPVGEYKVSGWRPVELETKLPKVPNVRVHAGLTAGIAWD